MKVKLFSTRKNPALYEINTVAWLFELSKKLGRRITLSEVPQEEWDRLEKSGIDLVWLMGVWKRSPAGRGIATNEPELRPVFDAVLPGWSEEDVIGSSYSICAYDPDPAIGGWEDIDVARAELHQHGIGLVLDFIPNHTGTDYPWINEHPDYYIQGSKGDFEKNRSAYMPVRHQRKTLYLAHGKDPYFPPWTDTVQLNYFNPALRNAVIGELKRIVEHCDGLRCDMAMLLLNDVFNQTWGWANQNPTYEPPAREFWAQALEQAPGIIWMAEAYWGTEPILLKLGFDYVYDKKLYDLVRWSPSQDVLSYLKADFTYQQRMLRFMENHDEPRSMTVFGKEKLVAVATLFFTLPGLKLYHHGQFEGNRIRLPLQLRQAMDEPPDLETRLCYEKLLALTDQKIFHDGLWQLNEVLPIWDESSRNLIAYSWQLGDEIKLVVVNLSPNYSQGLVSLKGTLVNGDRTYTLIDELNDITYMRQGKEMLHHGLHVILNGYQAHVFGLSLSF